MPRAKALPATPQQLAAVHYGVGLLMDAYPARAAKAHTFVGLRAADMAAVMAGVETLKQDGSALRTLAGELMALSLRAPAPLSAEAITTAQTLVSERVLTRIRERVQWLDQFRADKEQPTPTPAKKQNRGVYRDRDEYLFYAVTEKGDRIAEIKLGNGCVSPDFAIRSLYKILEQWEGQAPADDADDDDGGSEAWKAGSKS